MTFGLEEGDDQFIVFVLFKQVHDVSSRMGRCTMRIMGLGRLSMQIQTRRTHDNMLFLPTTSLNLDNHPPQRHRDSATRPQNHKNEE